MSNDLLNMNMGEVISEGGYEITRVPSGWIYRTEAIEWESEKSRDIVVGVSTVFVPFSAEPLVHP